VVHKFFTLVEAVAVLTVDLALVTIPWVEAEAAEKE
jgi:hypothetical protein